MLICIKAQFPTVLRLRTQRKQRKKWPMANGMAGIRHVIGYFAYVVCVGLDPSPLPI